MKYLGIGLAIPFVLMVFAWWFGFWFDQNCNGKLPFWIAFPMAVGVPAGLVIGITLWATNIKH